MSDPATRQDLHEMKEDLKEFFNAKFSALPCIAHDERLAGLAKKAEEIHDKAQQAWLDASLAKSRADIAADMASGNLWKLAKYGIIGFSAAAGLKAKDIMIWLSQHWRHHQ